MMKNYNLKRHYNTKHAAKYNVIQEQLRLDNATVARYIQNLSNNNEIKVFV